MESDTDRGRATWRNSDEGSELRRASAWLTLHLGPREESQCFRAHLPWVEVDDVPDEAIPLR